MGVRFSLVYPTRHRPAFVQQALQFLEKQQYQDFEVIVSDNYIDPALSCENVCRNSPLVNLRYVRPPEPVGMVENWNYALQSATGDYICYFTDKMFLLPDTLSMASNCIEKSQCEIVNWVDNCYFPKRFPDYFGEGSYFTRSSSVPVGEDFISYAPLLELSRKGRADVSRDEQDASFYARGKICFGAYSSELCNRIIEKTETLFHNVSADYTSMILALSMAKSAAEISQAGIVHMITDLSNGGQTSVHDRLAIKFLTDTGNVDEILKNLLVPGLYSSPHNGVAHDYLKLRKKYGLDFEFDPVNWLVYITEDLDVPGRQWSSKEVENQQRGLLKCYIDGLSKSNKQRYLKKYRKRLTEKTKAARIRLFIEGIKAILPQVAIKTLKRWLRREAPGWSHSGSSQPGTFANVKDILGSCAQTGARNWVE